MTRKARGIRLTDDCMARLHRLRRATGLGAYRFVEEQIYIVYDRYRQHPTYGPVLEALERAEAAEAAQDSPASTRRRRGASA